MYSCVSATNILLNLKHLCSISNAKSFPHCINRNYISNFSSVRCLIQYLKRFGNYEVIKEPSVIIESSPCVPSYVIQPSYAATGIPLECPSSPELKSKKQILGMRESCRIARSVLDKVSKCIKVGITTEEIDLIVRNKAFESSSYPSTLNYRGFPKSCCTSVNNVACHGIPDTRPLLDGDIVSVDVTVFYKGFHGDCCETFLIGAVDEQGKHLVHVSRECRDTALSICGPGVPFSDIGKEVEAISKRENLTVVPAFIGHGIGEYFHGPPDIYFCLNFYPGVMRPGMTFTIEPIIAQGSEAVLILEDGWTAVMEDDGRAAQFEHTILITETGHEALTCY